MVKGIVTIFGAILLVALLLGGAYLVGWLVSLIRRRLSE